MKKQQDNAMNFFNLIIGVILLSLLCTACSTAHSNVVTRPTYSYYFVSPSTDTFHPGDQIIVVWKAHQNPSTTEPQTQASPIQLKAEMQGPGAVKTKQYTGNTIFALSVKTDNWTSKTYQRVLRLPSDLAPGDYELNHNETIFVQDHPYGTAGGALIHIVKITLLPLPYWSFRQNSYETRLEAA
ncbi:MAG TPA: hypothetical protein VHZ51_27750 [Ktedonobacteraceae bacterium]|nr:hypothetical protein [Ktedonobacteraceae bacterium]